MKFDMTITLGTLVQIIALPILAAIWRKAWKVYAEFQEMRERVDTLWLMFVGDDSERHPGLEQRVNHAVRGAINDEVWTKELARRVRDYL